MLYVCLYESQAVLSLRKEEGSETDLREQIRESVKALMKAGFDPDVPEEEKDGQCLSHLLAVSDRHLEEMRLLLEHGADPRTVDKRGQTPLHIAMRDQSWETGRLLVSFGAPLNLPDEDLNTPLHISRDYDFCEFLISHGARPNRKNAKKHNGEFSASISQHSLRSLCLTLFYCFCLLSIFLPTRCGPCQDGQQGPTAAERQGVVLEKVASLGF